MDVCGYIFEPAVINWNTILDAGLKTSAIFATLTGMQAFNLWRKQTLEKRKIELAEEAIDLWSRLPNIFSKIRSPIEREFEGQTQVQEGETINLGHVFTERILKFNSYFEELDKMKAKFSYYFGEETLTTLNTAIILINKIMTEVSILKGLYDENTNYPEFNTEINEIKNKLWLAPSKINSDPWHQELIQAQQEIFKLCKPVTDQRSLLEKWLISPFMPIYKKLTKSVSGQLKSK